MDFKDTFLKLTAHTTPYKTETDLEAFLLEKIPDLQRDVIGNYHKIIGESETLFTCHLDNYCKSKEKVNHVIGVYDYSGEEPKFTEQENGNIIATDKTTVLGGDNKAGVTILLYLIEQQVPGHYCFFIGEESAVSGGGCFGSGMFAFNYKNLVENKKRAVAFDRRATGSIITRQAAQPCCSDEFADHLADLFAKQDMEMRKDPTGYYTDTSSFLEIIPECTNLSSGVYNEHTKEEYVNIEYLEAMAIAAAKIDWESLPAVREPKPWLDEIDDHEKYGENEYDAQLYEVVRIYLAMNNYMQMNRRPFQPGRTMTFNHWFKESKIEVVVDTAIHGTPCAIVNGVKVDIDPKNEKKPINPKKFKRLVKSFDKDEETVSETETTEAVTDTTETEKV